jgi:UDP-GlcNAc:undecaprenyl-phosphate GlcNAc-1-phosphate transferase
LSVIALLAIALLFEPNSWPAVIGAGACIGFLVFNLPDATMFLGDGGSHFLGAVIGILLLLNPPSPGGAHAVEMLFLVGVPLFELIFLVVVRMRKGLKWWRGSPDHLALRLQGAGLSKLRTDMVAWSAAVILVMLAAVARSLSGNPWITFFWLTVYAVAALLAGQFLVGLEKHAQQS